MALLLVVAASASVPPPARASDHYRAVWLTLLSSKDGKTVLDGNCYPTRSNNLDIDKDKIHVDAQPGRKERGDFFQVRIPNALAGVYQFRCEADSGFEPASITFTLASKVLDGHPRGIVDKISSQLDFKYAVKLNPEKPPNQCSSDPLNPPSIALLDIREPPGRDETPFDHDELLSHWEYTLETGLEPIEDQVLSFEDVVGDLEPNVRRCDSDLNPEDPKAIAQEIGSLLVGRGTTKHSRDPVGKSLEAKFYRAGLRRVVWIDPWFVKAGGPESASHSASEAPLSRNDLKAERMSPKDVADLVHVLALAYRSRENSADGQEVAKRFLSDSCGYLTSAYGSTKVRPVSRRAGMLDASTEAVSLATYCSELKAKFSDLGGRR